MEELPSGFYLPIASVSRNDNEHHWEAVTRNESFLLPFVFMLLGAFFIPTVDLLRNTHKYGIIYHLLNVSTLNASGRHLKWKS